MSNERRIWTFQSLMRLLQVGRGDLERLVRHPLFPEPCPEIYQRIWFESDLADHLQDVTFPLICQSQALAGYDLEAQQFFRGVGFPDPRGLAMSTNLLRCPLHPESGHQLIMVPGPVGGVILHCLRGCSVSQLQTKIRLPFYSFEIINMPAKTRNKVI